MKILKRTGIKVEFLALIFLLAGSHAIAADVKLAWDANTEADLAGYKVYYGGASRVYGTPTPIGKITAYTVTGLTPGTYYFAITAINAGGQESGYSNEVFTSIAGATSPTIAITSPTSSGTYITASAVLSIGGTASDDVGVTQVSWSNNRGGSGNATGTANWSASGIVLLVGPNVITVTARDAAGNSGTATLTVTYSLPDTTAPTIAITTPTSSGTYSTSSVTVSMGGTASDNVGVTQVTWANNRGGSGTATGTTSWNATVTLQSGSNVITMTARDAVGNNGTATLTVTYTPADTTAPTIAITTPTSSGTYTASSVTVSMGGTASDNVGVTQVTWANNRGGSGTATGTTSWSATVTLQSGSNVITMTARDAAGNSGTATLTVTYTPTDTTAPTVSITTPTSSGTYSASSATLSMGGTASDNVGVTQVTWANSRGGSGTATGTTSWSATVALQSGSNVITMTARDAAGNSATATLTVTCTTADTTAPTIAITTPTSSGTYRASSATLSMGGTASDNVGVIQVTWVNTRGGSGTATGTTSWSATVTLQSGSNVIVMTAQDAAGNSGMATLTVTYTQPDPIAPTIAITTPTSSGTYTASSATLSMGGTASDNVGVIQVTWVNTRGGSGTATGTTSWSATVTLQSGSNVIVMTAQDAAGNSGTATMTVTYTQPDPIAPTITITTPTSSGTYSTSSATMSMGGTASDNVGVTLVTWANNRGGSGTATGTTNWSATATLQSGSNVITMTARDAAGNNGTALLSVNYTPSDQTPPVISAVVSFVINGTSTRIQWLTDEEADSQVEYGTSSAYGTVISGDAKTTTLHSVVLTGLTSKTLYHYRVRSRDAAGNQAVSSDYTFTQGIGGNYILTYPMLSPAGLNSPGVNNDSYTGIALTNLSPVTANLIFTAFDGAGALLLGPGVTNPATRVLNAGQQLPIVDTELFGSAYSSMDAAGWIKVESDLEGVVGFFLMFNSNITMLDGANLSSTPLDSFVLPEIQENGFTRVNVANANNEPATIVFDLLKADGTPRASASRLVSSNGAFVADVSGGLFAGVTPAASDYLRVTSSKGVLPFEMVGKNGQDMAMLGGLDRNGSGSALYAPQYVVGGPWKSTISVINLDPTPGTLLLSFFGENGIQIGVSRVMSISGNGKVYIDDQSFFIPAGKDFLQGYVQVASDGIHVTGSVTFGDAQGKGFTTALPMVSTLLNSVLFGHIASNDIYFTGFALLNPNSEESIASVALYSAAGLLQNSKQVRIPARQRKSGLLTELFPELIGQDRTSGYVKVMADKGMASYAVFGTNSLSVLSAIPPQIAP